MNMARLILAAMIVDVSEALLELAAWIEGHKR